MSTVKNTHLHPPLPRCLLPSSARRAPNSRLPAGSRLRSGGRLLGRLAHSENAEPVHVSVWNAHAMRGPQHCHQLGGRSHCRGCPCPTKARNGTSTATPNRAGVGQAAAGAPSCPTRQLRKITELLGPCLKFCTKRAPPPSPARQHRLRLGAMSSGSFSCSDGPKSCKPFPSPRQGKHHFNLSTSSTAKAPEFAQKF